MLLGRTTLVLVQVDKHVYSESSLKTLIKWAVDRILQVKYLRVPLDHFLPGKVSVEGGVVLWTLTGTWLVFFIFPGRGFSGYPSHSKSMSLIFDFSASLLLLLFFCLSSCSPIPFYLFIHFLFSLSCIPFPLGSLIRFPLPV